MAQPTKPGNAERGWNDPPVLLHTGASVTPQVAPPPQKRTLLNKRVAFPVLGAGSPSSNTSESTLGSAATPPSTGPLGSQPPPPPTTGNIVLLPPAATTAIPQGNAPIIVPNLSPPPVDSVLHQDSGVSSTNNNTTATGASVETPEFLNDQQMFNYVSSTLLKVLHDCEPLLGPRPMEDVRKRLGIFNQMWEDGKISYSVKVSMAKLATALHKRLCDLAHEIHLALMMDYVSEVGQWMVGIKRLIQEARNLEPSSPIEPLPSNPLQAASVPTIPVNTSDSQTNLQADSTAADTSLSGRTSDVETKGETNEAANNKLEKTDSVPDNNIKSDETAGENDSKLDSPVVTSNAENGSDEAQSTS